MGYSADQKLREALQQYYAENGIPPDGGASEKTGRAKFGPITLYVPNFPARVAALRRHDLHHILLDADTSMRGEAVVGGFETAAGCGPFWVAWFLEPQTIVYGLILNPRQTFQSFLLGRRSECFYHGPFQERWLEETVGGLRRRYLAQGSILATPPDFPVFIFWVLVGLVELSISLLILLFPFLLLAQVIQVII